MRLSNSGNCNHHVRVSYFDTWITHFPNIGNNLFICASSGCAPYSQTSNASAYFTSAALSFPYHFSRDALTSVLIVPPLGFASHLMRSFFSLGTCSKKCPIQGSTSTLWASWASSADTFLSYTDVMSTAISGRNGLGL